MSDEALLDKGNVLIPKINIPKPRSNTVALLQVPAPQKPHKKRHGNADKDEDLDPGTPAERVKKMCMAILHFIKVAWLVIFVCYSWRYASLNREKKIAALHELSVMGFSNIVFHHDKALNAPNSEHDNFIHLSSKDLKAVDPPQGEAAAGEQNKKLFGIGLEHLRALDVKANEHTKIGTPEEKKLRVLASEELKRLAIFDKDFFDKFST